MCQICQLNAICDRARWPKPLEPRVEELRALVKTAHTDATNFDVRQKLAAKQASSGADTPNNAPDSSPATKTNEGLEKARSGLTLSLRSINVVLDILDKDRVEWWNSPSKKQMRREWTENLERQKLADLNRINNAAADRIKQMQAVVGQFAKWTLGVEDGLED